MNKTELMNKLSRSFNKVGFAFKKHSPTIMVVGGTIGVVASTVMACKATTKLETILDEAKERIDDIHEAANDVELVESGKYTVEDSKKDLAIVYAQTGVQVLKLYGPAIAVGTASLVSILMSHRIMTKRNIALAAAYTAVEKSFKEYRGRVVERFGEEIERQLKYNIKPKEIEVIETDENGKETVTTKTIDTVDCGPVHCSPYAKFFDVGNPYWEKDADYNLMFLRQQQNYANDKLKAKGMLFLNEVYEMLGIPKTKAGQVVGWVYDEVRPIGDNFVDFGIYDINRESSRDFVNGYEPTILLDFNVDGNVWDLM